MAAYKNDFLTAWNRLSIITIKNLSNISRENTCHSEQYDIMGRNALYIIQQKYTEVWKESITSIFRVSTIGLK
jgi:hypothetical protein